MWYIDTMKYYSTIKKNKIICYFFTNFINNNENNLQ